MKGHIRERSPGHWAIVLDVRDPETEKRKRKWHSFRGTKREAQTECSRLVTEFAQGSYVEPSKTTLLMFLDKWLEQIEATVDVADGIDPQICRQRWGPPPHPEFLKTRIRNRSQHASTRHF